MSGPPDLAALIRDQFPGWTLWVSGTGRWWASRQVELTVADLAAGCVPFLHADGPRWPRRSAPSKPAVPSPLMPDTAALLAWRFRRLGVLLGGLVTQGAVPAGRTGRPQRGQQFLQLPIVGAMQADREVRPLRGQ